MNQGLPKIVARLEGGGRICILGIGDSLTYGWMVEAGFFSRFCRLVEETWPGAAVHGINAGIPGDTAAQGRRRLPGLLRHEPDLVVIQFGLNDCFNGVELSSFKADIQRMAEDSLRAGAVPMLVTSCRLEWENDREAVRPYYDAIRAVGSELDVPVADLERYWTEQWEAYRVPLLLSDGAHPTDAGHLLMARGLLARLME